MFELKLYWGMTFEERLYELGETFITCVRKYGETPNTWGHTYSGLHSAHAAPRRPSGLQRPKADPCSKLGC